MENASYFNQLISSITNQGKRLLKVGKQTITMNSMAECVIALLSEQGEAKGVAVAQLTLETYLSLDDEQQLTFFNLLIDDYGSDHTVLNEAISSYQKTPSDSSAIAIYKAAEPVRHELFKRLNRAQGGTRTLLAIRERVIKLKSDSPSFEAIDTDLHSLFSLWFNRGFLVLRQIDWHTPASILEKIIKYEAVHEITSWNDLRRRIGSPDRRCYGFFHPALSDEPLIFVEVALTKDIANAILPILNEDRIPIASSEANTAVFYSISNCQNGLKGITFGNFLIKQVVQEIRRDIESIKQYVTLSPVPTFNRWLMNESVSDAEIEEQGLTALAYKYFTQAKHKSDKPYDPVARFHLGNGAILQQINENADLSPHGIKQSRGLMVNYLYDVDAIESNHERYIDGEVVVSKDIKKLLK